jgi:hypothetical protein
LDAELLAPVKRPSSALLVHAAVFEPYAMLLRLLANALEVAAAVFEPYAMLLRLLASALEVAAAVFEPYAMLLRLLASALDVAVAMLLRLLRPGNRLATMFDANAAVLEVKPSVAVRLLNAACTAAPPVPPVPPVPPDSSVFLALESTKVRFSAT